MTKRQPGGQGRNDPGYVPCLRKILIVVALNGRSSKPGALGESPTSRRARPGRATTASALAAAPASLCLCHGSDSHVDCVVVTVGDHRTVCSPQPAAAERRPPSRGARFAERAQRPAGVAAETCTGSGRITSGNAERCVAAGSGRRQRREGRERRRRARRAGALRRLDVRAFDFHRACASAGHEARARQAAPLTARMMGHGLGRAAQHYAERDGRKGAALRPAGGGIPW